MDIDQSAGEQMMEEEDLMANVKETYEIFVQNNFESTSHTLEWLNITNQDPEHANFEFNYFLYGTDNSEQMTHNSIILGKIRLPKLVRSAKQVIDYTRLDRRSHSQMKTVVKIPFSSEVLKCRMNPNQQGLVASVHTSGVVELYQISDDFKAKEVGKLHGLNQETFCLSWNKKMSNLICSAAGQQVCIWDITTTQHAGNKNQLLKFLNPHGQNTINDVRFSPLDPNLVITAGQDGMFKIWDLRDCGYRCQLVGQGSDDELNCATFNSVNWNMFAVAGEQTGMVGVWDTRMPDMVLNDLVHHSKQVTGLEWHPTREQIFVSSGEDGKVYLWDNSKCGEEQARKDYEDGPPELVFPHIHHSSLIEDICWQPNSQLDIPCVASVENQFALQIWRPLDDFFQEESDLLEHLTNIPDQQLE